MLLKYKSGKIYQGEVDDTGKPSGRGVMCYPDGRRYEGDFRDGAASGKGSLLFANGNFYRGEFQQGKMHGTGRMTYYDGTEYTGQWANNAIINDAEAWRLNPDRKES